MFHSCLTKRLRKDRTFERATLTAAMLSSHMANDHVTQLPQISNGSCQISPYFNSRNLEGYIRRFKVLLHCRNFALEPGTFTETLGSKFSLVIGQLFSSG